MACKVAADLYNIPTRIARVRNIELQQHPRLMGEGGFRATQVIFPEQTVTDYLLKLVDFPEALQVLEFADGRASLIAVKAFAGGPLVSQPIKELRRHIPSVDTRIVALFRDDASVRVDGDTMILPGDEVFFLAATRDVRAVMNELRRMERAVRTRDDRRWRQHRLAVCPRTIHRRRSRRSAAKFIVKLIETNKRRAEFLAQQTPPDVLVLLRRRDR